MRKNAHFLLLTSTTLGALHESSTIIAALGSIASIVIVPVIALVEASAAVRVVGCHVIISPDTQTTGTNMCR